MNISPFLPLLLQFIFVNSQHPSENTSIPSSHDSVTNFQPSLAVVIAMLALMFFLTFVLLLYAKLCHRSTTTPHHNHDGLVDKSSLPFFRFSSLKGAKQGLECAVCLAKFEDAEVMRLLPKCKHAFHIDCIDLWLEKHATCPLCRRSVSAGDVSEMSRSVSWRFLWEESNVDLYIEREASSRFSICSSFREEEIPIPKSVDSCNDDSLDRFNHKIVVALKTRWSSSDLMQLESTSDSIKLDCGSGSEARLDPNEKRSVSEIVVHPRFITELREERMKRLSQPQGLDLQTSIV